MTAEADIVERWKTPEDLKRWLASRFERLVATELRAPGAAVDSFKITAPGLTAAVIAERFAALRAWASAWQDAAAGEPELDVVFYERQTRNFGRVHVPKTAQLRSIDGVARLVRRTRDLTSARRRYAALMAADGRLAPLADHWPQIVAMSRGDFAVLCRFVTEAAALDLARLRLREVSCPGMHTKFLENHRRVLKPILAALHLPPNPDAQSWAGRLGFVEDATQMFALRDLDGGLLPYGHLALSAGRLTDGSPLRSAEGCALRGVVIVENQATFHALPGMPGIVAIFGQGAAVRALGTAAWLAAQPLLYLGDLDHAGFQMVAGLRRDGLAHLETTLMDVTTAETNRRHWVKDTSVPGASRAYEGLAGHEHAAQRLMATGPWRLEQERIPFDMLVDRLKRWHLTTLRARLGMPASGRRRAALSSPPDVMTGPSAL